MRKCAMKGCSAKFKGARESQALGMHLYSKHGVTSKGKVKKRAVRKKKKLTQVLPKDRTDLPTLKPYEFPGALISPEMSVKDFLGAIKAERDLIGERYAVLDDIVQGIENKMNGKDPGLISFEQTPSFKRVGSN